MKLFAGRRRARRLEKELGDGLWRQAHDRFVRGLDRYHQVVEGVDDDVVHNHLVAIGDELADQLPAVRDLCRHAHRLFPAEGMNIPGRASELHSCLSKAANHVATTPRPPRWCAWAVRRCSPCAAARTGCWPASRTRSPLWSGRTERRPRLRGLLVISPALAYSGRAGAHGHRPAPTSGPKEHETA
ncbi:hypothetical protein [Nesterenkonia sp. PF2B19]|uniref:hypothetical protein n=1 Tax=Nesterenkonia sp. PF2B19 TaxID=1881858 RepID=UPI000B262553